MTREAITKDIQPRPMRWHWIGGANCVGCVFVLRVDVFRVVGDDAEYWSVKTIEPRYNGIVTWLAPMWAKVWLGEVEGLEPEVLGE